MPEIFNLTDDSTELIWGGKSILLPDSQSILHSKTLATLWPQRLRCPFEFILLLKDHFSTNLYTLTLNILYDVVSPCISVYSPWVSLDGSGDFTPATSWVGRFVRKK